MHLTQSRLQVTGCTVERYWLLQVVVQGPGSFPGQVDFSVRHLVAELWGVKLAQFLSRVSILTHSIDIANLSVCLCLSVCLSVRKVPVSDENGLTYHHSFFTIR